MRLGACAIALPVAPHIDRWGFASRRRVAAPAIDPARNRPRTVFGVVSSSSLLAPRPSVDGPDTDMLAPSRKDNNEKVMSDREETKDGNGKTEALVPKRREELFASSTGSGHEWAGDPQTLEQYLRSIPNDDNDVVGAIGESGSGSTHSRFGATVLHQKVFSGARRTRIIGHAR